MLLLSKPSDSKVQDFLCDQTHAPFSYTELGATRGRPPSGYVVDHYRICLGTGSEVFARAVDALDRWEMFHLDWVELFHPLAPIRVDQNVAVLIKHFGFWSLNACRVVYTIKESAPVCQDGFAYGTLADHMEFGEERFLIEWGPEDKVWYDVLAFSHPHKAPAKIAYPLTRMLQRRFAHDSQKAMRSAVHVSASLY